MEDQALNAKLERIFQAVFDRTDLTIKDDMTAADVEGWDSLAQINLIVGAENAFSIRFQTSEIRSIKDVGEFKRLIASKISTVRS